MPKFIDVHAKLPPMPPGALDEIRRTLGKRDQTGVTALNAYFTQDGAAYCISEAPNADAVCESHRAHGIPLDRGDVKEIANTLA